MNKIKKLFNSTIIKFLIVGTINTLFGTTIMFVSYNVIHLNYWISSALNYICGSILSYFLNKYFTFQNKEKSFKEIAKFIMNILLCYGISYGLAKPLIRILLSGFSTTIQDNVAMFTGMILFTVLNYFGQKFFVFENK